MNTKRILDFAARAPSRILNFSTALYRWTFHESKQRRHLSKWLASLRPGPSGLSDERPWMNFDAIEWLEREIQPTWHVFEYGSGGSTAFLARRAGKVVSIEHDPKWHPMVDSALRSRGLDDRCTYRLIEPRPLSSGESAGEFTSDVPRYADCDFRTYVEAIDEFPDASFDLVIVDGRSRVACASLAIPKIRPGGFLLLDNAQRERYRPVFQMMHSDPVFHSTGCTPYQLGPATTAVWRIG